MLVITYVNTTLQQYIMLIIWWSCFCRNRQMVRAGLHL